MACREVEDAAQPARADAADPSSHTCLRRAGDVARREVAERSGSLLEVVVALASGIWPGRSRPAFFGTQMRPVVAQRLRHQRQLRLVVALRDAGRVDLRERTGWRTPAPALVARQIAVTLQPPALVDR